MGINYGGKTDVGLKRENNQDFFLIKEFDDDFILMIVCDGMGGANGGREASTLAAQTFADYVENNIRREKRGEYLSVLENALQEANSIVCRKAKESRELNGMGTTLVCALFDTDTYYCLWVGDSRIYAIGSNSLVQLSHDHSYVQTLIDNGSISPEEAKVHPNRNIITKAVGSENTISADVCRTDSDNIKGILLCSDGLCGYVDENEIAKVCLHESDTQKCCDLLVDMANSEGGIDNITVVVHKKH